MKKKKWRLRRYHIDMKTRIAGWLVLIIVFGTIGFFSVQTILATEEVKTFVYTEQSTLDYTVCMNDIENFPERCLSSGRRYIANAIEYISSDFTYAFSASESFDFTYSYRIVAYIVALDRGADDKPLWNYEENIAVGTTNTVTDRKDLLIKDGPNMDYVRYNEMVTELLRKHGVNLTSSLTVTMYVSINGTLADFDEPIVINQQISMAIPLAEQTADVELAIQDINNTEMIQTVTNEKENIGITYAITILCAIFVLLAIIKLIQFMSKLSVSKTAYEKTLAKIFREYDQIIVETKNMPLIEDGVVIEVRSFSELLDAREAIGKPILAIKINNQKHWFLIINGDELYKFVLKAVDVENE